MQQWGIPLRKGFPNTDFWELFALQRVKPKQRHLRLGPDAQEGTHSQILQGIPSCSWHCTMPWHSASCRDACNRAQRSTNELELSGDYTLLSSLWQRNSLHTGRLCLSPAISTEILQAAFAGRLTEATGYTSLAAITCTPEHPRRDNNLPGPVPDLLNTSGIRKFNCANEAELYLLFLKKFTLERDGTIHTLQDR